MKIMILGLSILGSKISIINPINTIRSYLKKKEIEGSIEDSIEYSDGAAESENHETFISSSTGIEFLLIPAGEFIMGPLPKRKTGQTANLHFIRLQLKILFTWANSRLHKGNGRK
jgi:hypothetical protein